MAKSVLHSNCWHCRASSTVIRIDCIVSACELMRTRTSVQSEQSPEPESSYYDLSYVLIAGARTVALTVSTAHSEIYAMLWGATHVNNAIHSLHIFFILHALLSTCLHASSKFVVVGDHHQATVWPFCIYSAFAWYRNWTNRISSIDVDEQLVCIPKEMQNYCETEHSK